MPAKVGLERSIAAIAFLLLALSTSIRAQVAPLVVDPPFGSLSGGLDIKIAGAGFSAGVLGVFFAEAPSSLVTVIDDKTLLAVLPPGRVPASPVDVIVRLATAVASPISLTRVTFPAPLLIASA